MIIKAYMSLSNKLFSLGSPKPIAWFPLETNSMFLIKPNQRSSYSYLVDPGSYLYQDEFSVSIKCYKSSVRQFFKADAVFIEINSFVYSIVKNILEPLDF